MWGAKTPALPPGVAPATASATTATPQVGWLSWVWRAEPEPEPEPEPESESEAQPEGEPVVRALLRDPATALHYPTSHAALLARLRAAARAPVRSEAEGGVGELVRGLLRGFGEQVRAQADAELRHRPGYMQVSDVFIQLSTVHNVRIDGFGSRCELGTQRHLRCSPTELWSQSCCCSASRR
jgi:hypothetical protein